MTAVWARIRALATSGYVLYLAPSLAQGGVGFLLVPVTTYFLAPEDFGVFALVTVLTLPVRALAATGSRWVIGGNYYRVQEAERRRLLFTVLAADLALRTLLVLLVYLGSEPVLRVVFTEFRPEYVDYLHLALAATWAGSLWPTISFLFTVQGRPGWFAGISMLQVVVNAATTVVCLAVLGLGVRSLFLAMLASSAASLGVELASVRRSLSPSLETRWLREIWSTGMHSSPGGVAEMLSSLTDRVAVQRFAGIGPLGFYSHSLQYLAIFKMVTSALTNTLTPQSLRIFSEGADRAPLERALSAWYAVLGIAGVGVALFSDEVVALLTHGKFTPSAALVPIWYLLVFSTSHGIPYATFLIARKRHRDLMVTQLVPTVAGIGLVVLGAYLYGMAGAAGAVVATNVTVQGWRLALARRLGYRPFAERAFAGSVLVYAGVWLGDALLGWPSWLEGVVFGVVVPVLVVRCRLVSGLLAALSHERTGPPHVAPSER